MRMTLLVHVGAGALGLISGYVALSAAKGATLHRKSGMLFVYVMITMAITGLLVSAVEGVAPAINIPTALLTFYMIVTSLTTVRPLAAGSLWPHVSTMLMGMGIGLACFTLGINAVVKGGAEAGLAFPLFLFGAASLGASAGDRRLMRAGSIHGTARVRRHLWRMCFALFIGSIAFYAGPDRLPEALRSPLFRAGGVLLPIVVMTYWLWRLRGKQRTRTVRISTQQQAALAKV